MHIAYARSLWHSFIVRKYYVPLFLLTNAERKENEHFTMFERLERCQEWIAKLCLISAPQLKIRCWNPLYPLSCHSLELVGNNKSTSFSSTPSWLHSSYNFFFYFWLDVRLTPTLLSIEFIISIGQILFTIIIIFIKRQIFKSNPFLISFSHFYVILYEPMSLSHVSMHSLLLILSRKKLSKINRLIFK